MAIQQLTQPILNPIAAFDATKEHIISFIVIGGSQVVANRLTIQDNQTGNVVYSKIQSSLKLEHILPANTLQNGGYYNAIVETIDNANNMSSPSTPVPFYCYSSPVLTITNIPETETIGNGTYEFKGNYSQTEGELLNSYQFTLYNSNKEMLSQTPLIYYSTDSSLSYTFVGMSNDTSYYIELSGQTINNTKMTTGLLYFTVRYIQPASFAICDLVNDCANGYVQISSNIVAIDGRSNPDPPIYIDDKEVDLTDPDAWVNWNSGFRIQDDFTMGAWGRDFNDYQNIITLTNDINTEETPNRIELKWMIGDVVKEQLYYENINGKFINIENSKVGDIKNLEIYGNSTQFTTSAEYNTASGNPVQFEDGKEGTSLKIQELEGKSTQATRDGKNKFNLAYIRNAPNFFTVTDTGVNLTNAWVTDVYTFENVIKTFKPSTTYTMRVKAKVISRPSTILYHNDAIFYFYRRRTSTLAAVGVNVLLMSDKETVALGTEKEYITTFTTPEDMTDVRFISYTFNGNNDGSTTNSAQGEIDVSEIMLVEGTYTAENFPDFELYGVSPSPDYLSEIKSIGDNGNVVINQIGKNRWNNDDFSTSIPNENLEKSATGFKFTRNDLSGGRYVSNTIDIKANQKIIFSCNISDMQQSYLALYKNIIYGTLIKTGLTGKIEYTATEDETIVFSIIINSGCTKTEVSDIQIEFEQQSPYEPYFFNTYTIPLSEPLRSLPNGVKDTLETDGIHRRVGKAILDGSDDEKIGYYAENTAFYIDGLKELNKKPENNDIINVMSNYFKGETANNCLLSVYNYCMGFNKSGTLWLRYNAFTKAEELKTWLSTHNTEVIYELATETVEPYTSEQKEVINSMITKNGTNIIDSKAYMTVEYNYTLGNFPSPNNKMPIFSVGDVKNLINISDFNITYNQKYYQDTKTDFILKPNYTYTLSYNFDIKSSSTDLYLSVGYGNDAYAEDITDIVLYSSQTKGQNIITFTVPNNITENSYLWVRFVRTIILADVDVDISNIQLEKGKKFTNYQPSNEYNIYPTVTKKNLFDYDNSLYIKGQNVTYNEIDNGYHIKPEVINENAYLAIGIENIFTEGDLYGISYSTLGELDSVKLYRTNKNSQNMIDEIEINNGIFIAPSSSYDLQLLFTLNSSSLLNYIEVWNIQIEANNVVSTYQLYNKDYSQITLYEPLRGIGEYQDWIGIISPNLLNPTTASAIVEEKTDYFYNKLATYTSNVTVQYKNTDGNIISSETLASDSAITTPENCTEIHIDGLDEEIIKTNHLQVRKGIQNKPYLPYINEPSLIRNINKVIFDGSNDEQWYIGKISSDTAKTDIYVVLLDDNYNQGISVSILSDYFENKVVWNTDTEGIYLQANNGALMVRINKDRLENPGTTPSFKKWLSQNPITVYYELREPTITSLSTLNIKALKTLETYEPISNIYTNNSVLATLDLDYANSISSQNTQNAYVLLKCWNGNKMPYVIHSNYIDIPESTDNVFIWMRRKKNIFDLKIENLTKGS